jgi:hypothetical protein
MGLIAANSSALKELIDLEVFAAIAQDLSVKLLFALSPLGWLAPEAITLYEPPYWPWLRQLALSFTVEVGQSAQASLALAAVVEQFARASLVSATETIFEVE